MSEFICTRLMQMLPMNHTTKTKFKQFNGNYCLLS